MNYIENLFKRFSNGDLLFVGLIVAAVLSTVLNLSFPQGDGPLADGLLMMVAISGAITGMLAMQLLILSPRTRWHDRLFGGVTNTYSTRSVLAKFLFISMLVYILSFIAHPSVSRVINNQQALTSDPLPLALLAGAATAAIGMYALHHIFTVEFSKRQLIYNLFSPLGILFIAHLMTYDFLTDGLDMAKVLLVIVAVFAAATYLYGLIQKHLPWSHFYQYQVVEVDAFDATTTEVVLRPARKAMFYSPGQYAWVSFADNNLPKEAHPYVFASGNNGPYIRFSIRALGDYTSQINQLQRGSMAVLEGPYGGFNYMRSTLPYQVWIGGGLGAASFLSMARSLSPRFNKQVTIAYIVADPAEAIFYKEMAEIQQITGGRLSVVPIIESVTGALNEKFLRSFSPDILATEYFICGSVDMIKSTKSILKSAGVENRFISSQDFEL